MGVGPRDGAMCLPLNAPVDPASQVCPIPQGDPDPSGGATQGSLGNHLQQVILGLSCRSQAYRSITPTLSSPSATSLRTLNQFRACTSLLPGWLPEEAIFWPLLALCPVSMPRWHLLLGTILAEACATQEGEAEQPGVAHQARSVSSG